MCGVAEGLSVLLKTRRLPLIFPSRSRHFPERRLSMFEVRCVYEPTDCGPLFLPDDAEDVIGGKPATLRVSFRPDAYYPAEPDVGAGPDFIAEIETVELMDDAPGGDLGNVPPRWRMLAGLWRRRAIEFLERSHGKPMWAQAEREVAEAFGVPLYGSAA